MKNIFLTFLWIFALSSFNAGCVAAQEGDAVQGRLTTRYHKVSSGIVLI